MGVASKACAQAQNLRGHKKSQESRSVNIQGVPKKCIRTLTADSCRFYYILKMKCLCVFFFG